MKTKSTKTRTIRQTATIHAAPAVVYETLMDSKRHSQLTGCTARISRKVGGSFTAMESLRGKNLELVHNQKIVQTWQCDYEGWPQDHCSVLTILLNPVNSGTRLEFRQTGVPASCFNGICAAWHKYYWQPLKQLFGPETALSQLDK